MFIFPLVNALVTGNGMVKASLRGEDANGSVTDSGSIVSPPIQAHEEETEWLFRSAIGWSTSLRNLDSLRESFIAEGVSNIHLRDLGGDKVLLTFESIEDMAAMLEESGLNWLSNWFIDVKRWHPDLKVDSKRVVSNPNSDEVSIDSEDAMLKGGVGDVVGDMVNEQEVEDSPPIMDLGVHQCLEEDWGDVGNSPSTCDSLVGESREAIDVFEDSAAERQLELFRNNRDGYPSVENSIGDSNCSAVVGVGTDIVDGFEQEGIHLCVNLGSVEEVNNDVEPSDFPPLDQPDAIHLSPAIQAIDKASVSSFNKIAGAHFMGDDEEVLSKAKALWDSPMKEEQFRALLEEELEGHMGSSNGLRKWWWVVFVVMINSGYRGKAQPQVPCYFIFGDSLVDNGNNNNIASLARANYLPYGIDFPGGPTGRFSNGKTTVDVIAELLGFEDYIHPYSSATGQDILRGVNYASAAAGIRDETGQQLGARISMNGQVNNYKNTVSQVVELLGDEDSAANHLSQCIYSLGLGSNDYLNNYFMPDTYSTSRQYTPDQYADVLIQQYSQQIKTLYQFGARKFALIGVGQIGCSPNELAQGSPDGSTCVQKINDANQLFNSRLRSLVDDLNNDNADAKFIYINAYGIFEDIVSNPSSFGFRVTNAGCCGVGRNNGQITCLPFQTPCPNRNEYIFWDAFHPGEAANIIIGRRSYSAESSSDSYPMDIRRLAQV
ncbi:hypothetical protein Vadar_025009 [Vaccinium darrowii]|uniref:Uncharacterized protein n=1 Tax=Vaccinium darrowii TaxID=229202 RepID=A0ACB7XJT4_9ERIC|nr:hypothetical protein Vadar_025009 [Vaccinium darrowii]